MRHTILVSLLAPTALIAQEDNGSGPVEVFEVHSERTSDLPRGKEADGVIGDFVLRNDHIEALVSGNLPDRKANMSVHWNLQTPGCLYDLSVRGSNNDQLTFLGPGSQQGRVSFVRIIEPDDNPLGVPGVRTERTAALGEGRFVQHDYLLGADWAFLAVLSTYRNGRDYEWSLDPTPRWKQLTHQVTRDGIAAGEAPNPADHQGYAAAVCAWEGELRLGTAAQPVDLAPGEERTYLTFVAPASSSATAFGTLARLAGPVGSLAGALRDGRGQPVTTATIEIASPGGEVLRAWPDPQGRFRAELPPGQYRISVRDLGRPTVERSIEIRPETEAELELALEPAARIAVETRDAAGNPMPAKVQFIGIDGTEDPHFGVDIQAHGCRNVFMTETGAFVQQVDPGRYRVVITRGPEFDHAEHTVELGIGQTVRVSARLERVVDTVGWVSTDFHNHSTPSGDNYCGTDDRVINLAVEQIEFAPTTEHNRIYDWEPHIRRLGLVKEVRTIPGIELTGSGAHFNSFPLAVVPHVQDGGAPHWHPDPRITAIVLRDFQKGGPYRWVHLNHPNVGQLFRDRNRDGKADGGYPGLDLMIDASEVWSLNILGGPRIGDRPNRTFAWLQLLNQGMRMNCLAVADAHAVFGNSLGGWRTYVLSSEDRPDKLSPEEVIRNSKAGRMFVTSGPFLEVQLDDGTGIGSSTVIRGPFHIDVRVQCTDWIDINRVQVLVNGRQAEELNFTRSSHPQLFGDGVVKFEHAIPVRLEQDAHLIVAAVGEGLDLSTSFRGSRQQNWMPCAFTNPIYVDVDGHGFEPNGDTLGHPLPVG